MRPANLESPESFGLVVSAGDSVKDARHGTVVLFSAHQAVCEFVTKDLKTTLLSLDDEAVLGTCDQGTAETQFGVTMPKIPEFLSVETSPAVALKNHFAAGTFPVGVE